MGRWIRSSAAFKARVAQETLGGEKTLVELASRFGIHSNLVAQWKKKAQRGLVLGMRQNSVREDREMRASSARDRWRRLLAALRLP